MRVCTYSTTSVLWWPDHRHNIKNIDVVVGDVVALLHHCRGAGTRHGRRGRHVEHVDVILHLHTIYRFDMSAITGAYEGAEQDRAGVGTAMSAHGHCAQQQPGVCIPRQPAQGLL